MTWFRVDDDLEGHPKLNALRARFPRSWRQSVCLWTLAGSWSAKHETDGRIPDDVLSRFGATSKDAEALVSVGFWERLPTQDGYSFHDWLEYQPSSAQLRLKRESSATRTRLSRESGKSEAVSPGKTPSVTPSRPVPSRPSLSPSENSSNLSTTTTSPSACANDQSGSGSIDVTPPGAEHEGYRWLHATLGTIPADLGSWRAEYRTIGSKPAGERERVALHVQATAWCMQHRSKCTPRHILKHWLEFLEGPRNFELKPPTLALDFKSQREAAQKAATKARLEKFLERENAIVALAKTPADRERLEAEKWDRYNRLDRSLP